MLRPLYESPAALAQRSTIAVWLSLIVSLCLGKFLIDPFFHMVSFNMSLRLSLHSKKLSVL